MVADSKGEPHKSMGLQKGFDQVVAQVLSPSGQELARGPFPQSARKLSQSISFWAPGANPPTRVAGRAR
jgi:hypothetical protein